MATSLVNKIVLKNTTKMSLNERFTAYRAEAQTAANSYRQKIQMQRQASSANLRLAQQMANRPTVIAALRLKKRSLQQRLGRKQPSSNIKSRLNLGARRLNNSVRGRLGTVRGKRGGRRGGFKPGTSPLIKARLGAPKQGFNTNENQNAGIHSRRGFFRGGNRRGNNRIRGSRNASGGVNRGRGRGRGGFSRGRWNNPKIATSLPTRQELDNQLDEYMAETKGSLDAQLGQYMSQG